MAGEPTVAGVGRERRTVALDEAYAVGGDLPLPGAGRTLERWSALAALAVDDVVLARLAEAHADAVAIIAELTGEPLPPGSRWGVWAAEDPAGVLTATPLDGQGADWLLDGAKAWCSGATLLTHALVTARHGRNRQLLAVALDAPGVTVAGDDWADPGMKGADTRQVIFGRVRARAVGGPDDYLRRPGFWIGGIGVAACWYGGATAVAAPLRKRVGDRGGDPHAAAHLGAVDVALGGARDVLRAAAAAVDARPEADHARLARRVRATVAGAAVEVTRRVDRALGPAPRARDRRHAARVADLAVYILQDHGERDLAVLGADVATAAEPGWSLGDSRRIR
ncbi:acyl-CoA dehydrogenase family protein [Frankia gtarii]|uniref:acyl-CoA dehydrogenase family protein n=1 Tax=Frankia gtarii TaxID=2950102 RepID=UPI0021BF2BAB|nr:acyl-CoA dehydrogenase family protein [Frankia gtarii]